MKNGFSISHVMVLMFSLLWLTGPARGQQQPRGGNIVNGVLERLQQQLNFNGTRPLTPVSPANITQDMRRALQLLGSFSTEAGALIEALRFEDRYSADVRYLLGEAIQVKAEADVLIQRAQRWGNVSELAEEYRSLDRDWRNLSLHLKRAINLDDRVRARANRLDQISEQLANTSQVTPAFDQRELSQTFAAYQEVLNILADDVHIGLFNDPRRNEFKQRLQRLEQRAGRLQMAVTNQYPYQEIVDYYKKVHQDWLGVKSDLRTYDNRYIQRGIARVEQMNDRLFELLWLQPVIDGSDILHLATNLQQRLDDACSQISIRQMMEIPNGSTLFGQMNEFYNMSKQFRGTVQNDQDIDSVRWDFRVVDVAWNDLRQKLIPVIQTQQSAQMLGEIDSSIMNLRGKLTMNGSGNPRQAAVDLATQLDNMADLLHHDLVRVPGANGATQAANRFQNDVHGLHDLVMRNADATTLRRQVQQLGQQWNNLVNQISRLPGEQGLSLLRRSQQISPLIARLEVAYTY